jgi:hypothetical protein
MAAPAESNDRSLEESVVRLLLGVDRFVDSLTRQFEKSESDLIAILLDLQAQIEADEASLDMNPIIQFFRLASRPSISLCDFLTDLILIADPGFVSQSTFPIFVSKYHVNSSHGTCCFWRIDLLPEASVTQSIVQTFRKEKVSSMTGNDVLLFYLKSPSAIDVKSSTCLDLSSLGAPEYRLASVICQLSHNKFKTCFVEELVGTVSSVILLAYSSDHILMSRPMKVCFYELDSGTKTERLLSEQRFQDQSTIEDAVREWQSRLKDRRPVRRVRGNDLEIVFEERPKVGLSGHFHGHETRAVSLCYPVETTLSEVCSHIDTHYQAQRLFIKQGELYCLVPSDYPMSWGELVKTYPSGTCEYLLVGAVPLPKDAQKFVSVTYISSDQFRFETLELPVEIDMKIDRVAKWLPERPDKKWRLKAFVVTEGRIHDLPYDLAFEACGQNVCLQWVTPLHRPFLCLESGKEYHVRTGFFFRVRETDTFAQLEQALHKYFGGSWKVQVGFIWGDRLESPRDGTIGPFLAGREGWKHGSTFCVRLTPAIQ